MSRQQNVDQEAKDVNRIESESLPPQFSAVLITFYLPIFKYDTNRMNQIELNRIESNDDVI
jgi:hypothetical protein